MHINDWILGTSIQLLPGQGFRLTINGLFLELNWTATYLLFPSFPFDMYLVIFTIYLIVMFRYDVLRIFKGKVASISNISQSSVPLFFLPPVLHLSYCLMSF